MRASKVKLYDVDRYCIGETTIDIPDNCNMLTFGPEFFVRSKLHKNSFVVANGVALKNDQVKF